MNLDEKVALAAAHANSDAVGRMAVAGVTAICDELVRLGALDGAAIGRIENAMRVVVEQSGASQHLRRYLAEVIESGFQEVQAIAVRSRSTTSVSQ